jgi:hypothetical protein
MTGIFGLRAIGAFCFAQEFDCRRLGELYNFSG